MTRAIVLTPQITGADGVSEMSRQVVAALEAQVGRTLRSLEVWSLADAAAPAELSAATRFRTARGRRITFASFAIRSGGAEGALVIVLHAHLLPVTLPLIQLGARVVPVLLGIEVWKPLSRLERAALRGAWRVAAISQHTIARFREANPELAGIPVSVCHPGLAEPRPVASVAPVPNQAPFALIVGRMASDERYKGHDQLLEIWPRVRQQVPGATLVVAGGGDDRSRLVAKAESLGIANDVRFEGVVPAERLARLYRDAALFVMPSPNEGFGLVFAEAMRAGTPCIAAMGAAAEIVEDGVTGFIVRAGDRDALARAVTELLGDPNRRAAMGHRAAEIARRRFSAAAFAERLYQVLDIVNSPIAVRAMDAAC